mmetsp:Transcript_121882/g.221679  ORF Transcript_121882/g.221679 Transcript_121882/m.221679 type:complete len:210 (-) Transcript_121882:446-1075(-)
MAAAGGAAGCSTTGAVSLVSELLIVPSTSDSSDSSVSSSSAAALAVELSPRALCKTSTEGASSSSGTDVMGRTRGVRCFGVTSASLGVTSASSCSSGPGPMGSSVGSAEGGGGAVFAPPRAFNAALRPPEELVLLRSSCRCRAAAPPCRLRPARAPRAFSAMLPFALAPFIFIPAKASLTATSKPPRELPAPPLVVFAVAALPLAGLTA